MGKIKLEKKEIVVKQYYYTLKNTKGDFVSMIKTEDPDYIPAKNKVVAGGSFSYITDTGFLKDGEFVIDDLVYYVLTKGEEGYIEEELTEKEFNSKYIWQ